jgi:hypothetical protein
MREKILYVDAEPVENRDVSVREPREKYILRKLIEDYDAYLVYDLFSERVNSILEMDFDLLLTHVPFRLDREKIKLDYSGALDKLKGIIAFKPGMKVVAYTGAFPADVSDYVLKNMGIEGVVRKHLDNVVSDFEEISNVLKEVFGSG